MNFEEYFASQQKKKLIQTDLSFHSFRVYGSARDLFHHPSHVVIVAASLLLAVVSVHVLQQSYTTPSSRAIAGMHSVVLGEATSISDSTHDGMATRYEESVRSLVSGYLYQRANLFSKTDAPESRKTWLDFNNRLTEQLLNLRVPGTYKDFHVTLVSIMNNEVKLLTELKPGSLFNQDFFSLSNQLEDLLSQHQWMNIPSIIFER